jgi:hypothetical protein
VLIGASIGGAVVIDAGVHLHPQPAAVISLSAVPEVTNYPFPADAKHLASPIFQISSTEDPLTNDGKDTRTLFRASPSPSKRRLQIAPLGECTERLRARLRCEVLDGGVGSRSLPHVWALDRRSPSGCPIAWNQI